MLPSFCAMLSDPWDEALGRTRAVLLDHPLALSGPQFPQLRMKGLAGIISALVAWDSSLETQRPVRTPILAQPKSPRALAGGKSGVAEADRG